MRKKNSPVMKISTFLILSDAKKIDYHYDRQEIVQKSQL